MTYNRNIPIALQRKDARDSCNLLILLDSVAQHRREMTKPTCSSFFSFTHKQAQRQTFWTVVKHDGGHKSKLHGTSWNRWNRLETSGDDHVSHKPASSSRASQLATPPKRILACARWAPNSYKWRYIKPL